MSLETIFKIANLIALAGRLLIIVSIKTERFVVGIIITLLAIIYSYFIVAGFKPADTANFSTLAGIKSLFANDTVLLAGWIHYLAFDLMVGLFIRSNAKTYGISYWLVLPCLFFTFMLGPFGLLLYLVIRLIVVKKFLTQNF